jgi:hypothetical protein
VIKRCFGEWRRAIRDTLRGRLLGHAVSAALILVAVCLSALATHVGIDVVGDFALPHDTYDDVAHGSRTWVLLAAAGLLCAGAFGVLWSALEGEVSERGAPPTFGIVRRPISTGIAVFVLTVFAVIGMECLDASGSGKGASDLSGALGGSVWLGLGVTFVCALVSTLGTLRFARFVARAQSLLVRAFVALAVQLRLRVLRVGPRFQRALAPPRHYLLAIFLGRAHKRGPPVAA